MPDNNQNQIPSNLPTGDLPTNNEPVDILNDIDQAPVEVQRPQTVNKPVQPLTPQNPPPAVVPPQKSVSKEPVFSQGKKIIAGVVVLVLVATIVGASWYAYSTFFAGSSIPEQNIDQNINQSQRVDDQQEAPVVTDETPAEVTIDTDKDGLSDQEEGLYNTNPNRVDTDLDGLTDRDEVIVFKTDPNNPDTDGDTFLDGSEVRSGYDPNGPGRLLNINQ